MSINIVKTFFAPEIQRSMTLYTFCFTWSFLFQTCFSAPSKHCLYFTFLIKMLEGGGWSIFGLANLTRPMIYLWLINYLTFCGVLISHWLQIGESAIKPLSPNSDQQQFSPNDIHTLSMDKFMRTNKMITKEKKCFDLLSNSLNLFLKEMCRDQFGEFAHGYWGLKG